MYKLHIIISVIYAIIGLIITIIAQNVIYREYAKNKLNVDSKNITKMSYAIIAQFLGARLVNGLQKKYATVVIINILYRPIRKNAKIAMIIIIYVLHVIVQLV